MAPKTSADHSTTKSTTSHHPSAASKAFQVHAAKHTAESSSKATKAVSLAVACLGNSKGPMIIFPAPKKVKHVEPQPSVESQPDGESV